MKRIQRRRTKGWRMPPDVIYVGRPSKWCNPYRIGKPIQSVVGFNTMILAGAATKEQWIDNDLITRGQSLRLYEFYLNKMIQRKSLDLDELKGKDLACWCPLSQKCHADILIKLCENER